LSQSDGLFKKINVYIIFFRIWEKKMLNAPEKVHWVPKPGNPNFLVSIEKKTEEQEEKKKKKKVAPASASPPTKKGVAIEPTSFEQEAAMILFQALAPLYQFIGMVEAESGKVIYYRYLPGATTENKMIPINFGSESSEEFLRRNPHLGEDVVKALFESTTTGPGGDIRPVGVNINLLLPSPLLYPEWFWCKFQSPVFQFLLNSATFGALELAANEIGYPLKDLISSNDVNYMFAQFVARKFISPKNNAFPTGISGGQTQYRLSSGFNTSQMANSKWLMGCKEWFKSVYYAKNPRRPSNLREMEELRLDIARQEANVANLSPAELIQLDDAKQRLADWQCFSPNILKH